MLKTAKLFQNGRSQAVRLPKEFRFQGDEVFIKKMGDTVILMPYQMGWQSLFDSLTMFSDEFMADRAQPPEQAREALF